MSILIFIVVLALVYGLWGVTIRFALQRLSCTRTFSRPAFFAGEEGELIETVRNDGPFVIPWLRLESRISAGLKLGRQENLHASDEIHYCSLFTLMPYQQIRRRHRVQFLNRGTYDLGNAALTAGDMMGVLHLSRSQMLHAPVLVYPRLLDPSQIPLPLSRMLGETVRRQQLLSDPFLVRGLRTYHPGDPVRDIHWPATARIGAVYVRIHDYSAQTRLLVVLNMQSEELQWRDQLSEEDEKKLEYGIELAATACVQILREGLAAGFATNMSMVGGDGESTLLLPAGGTSREEELLTAFARLKTVRSQHFPVLLETLADQTGLDILILSRYDSESIQVGMERLRANGNQAQLYLFQEGTI